MKLTDKEFKERLESKYKGIYKVINQYKGMHEQVDIQCILHNETFTVRALDLIHGYCRCKTCSTQERLTKNLQLHKDNLPEGIKVVCSDNFETKRSEITFNCKFHGDFVSTFNKVIQSNYNGCRFCKSYKEGLLFIAKAESKHDGKYTYKPEDYVCSRTLMPIHCKLHDKTFQQRPSAHLQGQNCPDCGEESRLKTSTHTQEQFLAKCRAKHGNLYDYSEAVYKGSYKDITVICKDHGRFVVKPCNHLINGKCPSCSSNSRGYSLEDFITLSIGKFEDRFCYSQTDYTYSNVPLKLTCKLHNHTFSIKPNHHLTGSASGGCKYCGKLLMNRWSIESVRRVVGIDKSSGHFYIGKISGVDGYKLGVTNNIKTRQHCYNTDLSDYPESDFSYLGYITTTYLKSFILEEALKKVFENVNNTTHGLDFGGKNEVFLLDKVQLNFVEEVIQGEHLAYLEEYEDCILSRKSKHFKGLVEYFKNKIERKQDE